MNQVSTKKIIRSKFNRKFNIKTSFNSGELIPFYWCETLPSDKIDGNIYFSLRMNTPVKPVMDDSFFEVWCFYVPMRLLWQHTAEFFGYSDMAGINTDTYKIPTLFFENNGHHDFSVKSLSLGDYLGLPVGFTGTASALPFRAYYKIYNDFFRDENLQDSLDEIIDDDSVPSGYYRLQRVNKLPDYFTTSLPFIQKGPSVPLPLGDKAPVYGEEGGHLHLSTSNYLGDVFAHYPFFPSGSVSSSDLPTPSKNIYDNAYFLFGQRASNYSGDGSVVFSSSASDKSTGQRLNTGEFIGLPTKSSGGKSGVYADLSSATAATVNELRYSFALQRYFELDARSGTRYTEYLASHYGSFVSDGTLQRARYIGGFRQSVTSQSVAQTSSTDSTSPQGNLSAYSHSVGRDNSGFHWLSKEHGILMFFCTVRVKHSYCQGVSQKWTRQTRFDYADPLFCFLGEQPVYMRELYYSGVDSTDNQVFGYQEKDAFMRYGENICTALMRPSSGDNINIGNIWGYTDFYDKAPSLNSAWIQEESTNLDRTLAVSTKVSKYQFFVDILINSTWLRPLPYFSVPNLSHA